MNIGFLASHNGSNMQAVVDACKAGTLHAKPAVTIGNNSDSGALARARQEGIAHYHLSSKTHPDPDGLDRAILDALLAHDVDVVVLAGYMKKLGPRTLAHFSGAILNIHPALLPKFGGKGMYGIHVHEAVLAAGEKETGASIHLVDANYDTGAVIAQTKVPVLPGDTPATLQARVLEQEHILFPQTLQKIATGEIRLPRRAKVGKEEFSYAKAGVNIDVTDAAKREMAKSVDSGNPRVLNRMGAFASLMEGRFEGLKHPILVFKTEEPGSKQKLAFALGRVATIAQDLVHHLIDDMIVMGAEPLYMQDCIVCGTIDPELVAEYVKAMAAACREQGCVLVGGETSVQPGVLADGVYVLTASAIGVVDKDRILDGSAIREGDTVLALASNGLHTNGYTLLRKLLERNPALKDAPVEGSTFLDVAMRPHTCYYKAVRGLFGHPSLKGLAHITGGGIQDNLNRILPPALDASIDLSALRVPEIFRIIHAEGNVSDAEMMRTFNMGVGMAAVCSRESVGKVVSHLTVAGCAAYPIGEIVRGEKRVRFQGTVDWRGCTE